MRVSGVYASGEQLRSRVILWTFTLLLCVFSIIPAQTGFAAQITTRSLKLEPNGTNGASEAAVASNHHFTFTITTTSGIRSMRFQYCDAADSSTCSTNPPSGLTAASATLGATVGLAGTPTLDKTDTDSPYVHFTADPTQTAIEVTLTGIVNPTAVNTSFYVLISTYTTSNGSGSATDQGFVAASTASPIQLTGEMPESLIFCTGATIPLTGGSPSLPDCPSATSGDISFNQQFSTLSASTATSQMAASTNALSGYSITVQGETMSLNPSTKIAAIGTSQASNPGTPQFGMNLVDNAAPNVGSALGTGYLSGGNYNGLIDADYNTADSFTFVPNSAEVVATSNGDVSELEIYTASYIVNVSGSQTAGTYTTTLTYVCTATF